MPSCKCVLSIEVVRIGLDFLHLAGVQVIKKQLFNLMLQRFKEQSSDQSWPFVMTAVPQQSLYFPHLPFFFLLLVLLL